MPDDHLSEVFDLVEVQSVITGGIAARGGWRCGGPVPDPVKFFAMVSGSVRLTADGAGEPVELRPGDVAVLTGRSWVAFEAGRSPAGRCSRSRISPPAGSPVPTVRPTTCSSAAA